MVAFLGSTIGNFAPHERKQFLSEVAENLRPGDSLLLGTDLVKDVGRLEAAYDDAQGVTAAFNRNVLVHINRELGGNFDPAAFAHKAVWNARESRIEMHLESTRDQIVSEITASPSRSPRPPSRTGVHGDPAKRVTAP